MTNDSFETVESTALATISGGNSSLMVMLGMTLRRWWDGRSAPRQPSQPQPSQHPAAANGAPQMPSFFTEQ